MLKLPKISIGKIKSIKPSKISAGVKLKDTSSIKGKIASAKNIQSTFTTGAARAILKKKLKTTPAKKVY